MFRQAGSAFVVLQSFPQPRRTTNPYLVQLLASLAALPEVRVHTFTWRRALLGGYDVFHVHWPEILVSGHSPVKKLVRQLLFALLLLRLRLTRTPLVRTVHNLELPDGISRREVALLRWAQRWTTLRIAINDSTPLPEGTLSETILHGHYRDWFSDQPRIEAVAGRITFFGFIRRYKGVEGLVAAFRETAGASPPLSLAVAGKPSTEALGAALRSAAAGDKRISLSLDFLDDAALVAEVSAAELVVLPYREMHNSGGALSALSLDRPVLVPDNAINRRLAAEVGEGWVLRYTGELTGADLVEAVADLQRSRPAGRPDLSRREWDSAGPAHLAAYRRAVAALRAGRRDSDRH